MYSSLRNRSGSVGREPSTASYRPSFSTRTEITSSRFSRASSCDPTARCSSRPPPSPSMSHSYHSDYAARSVAPSSSYSSRYASTGNLSSGNISSYRSPYSSASTYRSGDSSNYRSQPSAYRASSSFTPRYESRLPPRDFSYSSLSKYRPETPSSYSRPTYTSQSSSYSMRPQVEFRSKTPAASETPSRHSRFDREYKSLSRFEKTPVRDDKSEDEVENTFQKLYNRYVKEADSPEAEKPKNKKKFISHSEAEEATSEEDVSLGDSSFAEERKREKESVTPKGPSPSLVTPTASPLPRKKVVEEAKEAENKAQTAEEFRLKHRDVQMNPAVIEPRVPQAPTAMTNLLKMSNLTAKLSEVFQKKKVEPETKPAAISQQPKLNGASKAPVAVNKTITVTSGVDSKKVMNGIEKKEQKTVEAAPKAIPLAEVAVPTTVSRETQSKQGTETSSKITTTRSAGLKSPVLPGNTTPPSTAVTPKSSSSISSSKLPVSNSMPSGSLSVPGVSASGAIGQKAASVEPKRENLLPPGGKAKSSSPRPKPALTIDTKKAEEASTSVTILMSNEEQGKMADGEKKKLRDRTRTLENMLKEVAEKSQEEKELITSRPPPLLLVTQASVPSTPKAIRTPKEEWGSGSGSYYGSDEDGGDEEEEEGWTEGEDEQDYDSDLEFCISETFRIPAKTPLYPPSFRGSPYVSDYESDCSGPFLASQKLEDSRGRVNRLFAVPPPTFTCSVSFDGQESWETDSVHSCEEEEEEDEEEELRCRPGSSSLAAYRSPGPFESDEDLDGAHFHDSVQVGYVLKLVDKAARRESDETDSEYYDDEEEEYSEEEEYWDEDEDDEEFGEEEETDEECMISAEETSPSPPLFTASFAEEQLDLDETEDATFDLNFELALPEAVVSLDSTAAKHREVTYTKDLEMNEAEETAGTMEEEGNSTAKAVAKRIKKDGTTESASKTVVPQMVVPVEEVLDLMEAEEVPTDVQETLSPLEVEGSATSDVSVVPTFVRPLTEKVQEEHANRFAATKPQTDFAKKAVIQPAKLLKVQVISAKVEEASPKRKEVPPKENAQEAPKPADPKTIIPVQSKPLEDKSSLRKSALNMKEEDAKKKAVADEEAARQKARRFGTVSALADKFKDTPREESITYKRSSRLAPKDDAPRPRRKYEIIQPVLNDEFDKQMAEIRAQMKTGSSLFQSELRNLSSSITSTTEEAKKIKLDDKHRQVLDKVSGVFGKAEEEKQKWRERKMGKSSEATKEKKKPEEGQVEEPKKEPKRTIRRLKRGKDSEVKEVTLEGPTTMTSVPAKVPVPPSPAKEMLSEQFKKDRPPVVNPAEAMKKPNTPSQGFVIDDNNLELLKAATKVVTHKRGQLLPQSSMEAKRTNLSQNQESTQAFSVLPSKITAKEADIAKTEGVPTIKNKNTLASSDSPAKLGEKQLKRYATRRKTQEIVNESLQPKRRRRLASRHGKFISVTHDIDVLLGWGVGNSFETFETRFLEAAKHTRTVKSVGCCRRMPPIKIWISDLTDIDKIYKASEIRDIKASVDVD